MSCVIIKSAIFLPITWCIVICHDAKTITEKNEWMNWLTELEKREKGPFALHFSASLYSLRSLSLISSFPSLFLTLSSVPSLCFPLIPFSPSSLLANNMLDIWNRQLLRMAWSSGSPYLSFFDKFATICQLEERSSYKRSLVLRKDEIEFLDGALL